MSVTRCCRPRAWRCHPAWQTSWLAWQRCRELLVQARFDHVNHPRLAGSRAWLLLRLHLGPVQVPGARPSLQGWITEPQLLDA